MHRLSRASVWLTWISLAFSGSLAVEPKVPWQSNAICAIHDFRTCLDVLWKKFPPLTGLSQAATGLSGQQVFLAASTPKPIPTLQDSSSVPPPVEPVKDPKANPETGTNSPRTTDGASLKSTTARPDNSLEESNGNSSTYFVDYESGSDSNDGRSTTTAWKHCPGDKTATSVAKNTTLAPGDTVRFKGGVVYSGGAIVLNRSGNSKAPIIYDGNQSETWGTGRAIIDKNNLRSGRCFKANANVSHITIKSFECRNVGGYADDDPILATKRPLVTKAQVKHGIAMAFNLGGNKHIRIENCYFHRIGNWRMQLPFSGALSIVGSGIQITDAENLTIKECEFTKVAKPIEVRSQVLCKNIDIDSCHIHNYVVWGIDVTALKHGATIEGVTIHGSRIHDYHEFDFGNWSSPGEAPHTNGIFFRTNSYRSNWRNNRIYDNFFFTDSPANSKGGTASIHLGNGPSVTIYNNVFIRDRHGNSTIGILKNSSSLHGQVVRIYNNTFVSGPTHIMITGATTNREIHIQNNIFYKSAAAKAGQNHHMIHYVSGSFPKTLDNNLYFDPNWNASLRSVFKMGSSWRNLASLKRQSWEAAGAYANPQFVSLSGRPGAHDVKLKAQSPAKLMGQNLSEYFTSDAAGNSRPPTGPWTVGAYQ